MRLLLFIDLHCNVGAAEALVEMAQDADVLVGAGDFGNVRRGVELCLDVLRSVERPAVLVPGNNESLEELVAAVAGWKTARVLHTSSCSIDGITFFGLGGGIPTTPFGDWSFDFTEAEAAKMLSGCPAECVLVSHSPPKGVVDVSSSGRSLGSVAVRQAIESKRPRLVVCGHVHASAGQEGMIGGTAVVNAGPDGVFWDLTA
jgi:Icc-related predicted phosphoesterase